MYCKINFHKYNYLEISFPLETQIIEVFHIRLKRLHYNYMETSDKLKQFVIPARTAARQAFSR